MKRHESLIPLTHDHHHALAQARRLRLAAGREDDERLRQAREFIEFFQTDTINHFREEEEVVFPLAIEDERATPLLAEVVVEHLRIHALVGRLAAEVEQGKVTTEAATDVAETLERHIRLEEGKVFPLLEEVVPADRLTRISLEPRTRAETSE